MSVSSITAFVVIFSLLIHCISASGGGSGAGKCLEGKYHKPTPSPEGPDFAECHSWKNRSCCNVNLTLSIKHHKAKKLYDYHWDRCGPLTTACEMYIKDEECFYSCEPRLYHFRRSDKPKYIKGVPICASFCDKWFDACKDDKTCVSDWLGDYNYTTGENHCPSNSKCVTFREMYKNGEGLCNKMWGVAFIYQKSNKNCMVMKFDPSKPNPNSAVVKITSTAPKLYFSLLYPLILWACILLFQFFCM